MHQFTPLSNVEKYPDLKLLKIIRLKKMWWGSMHRKTSDLERKNLPASLCRVLLEESRWTSSLRCSY